MYVIDKKREFANQVKEMTLIGDVTGKNVVMIDDMIDTATTLVKASNLLLDKGALSVTVFATHGVLSYRNEIDNAEYRLIKSNINKIYISNTIDNCYDHTIDFITEEVKNRSKIINLDVSGVFAKAIEKIQSE